MDERKPLHERRVAISKAPNSFVQRSCSLPIIRPCAGPKQLLVHVPCYTRRELIADRPHRTNNASVTHKQHPRCDMDGLVGEILVTHRRLTCGEKGKPTMGSGQCDHVRELQAASIGETKSTLSWTPDILDSVACKVDPVRLLHQGNFSITALMCSNSASTPGSWNSPSECG